MTEQVTGLRIRGDKVAYVSDGPIVVLNEKGNPLDPQPPYASIGVNSSGLLDSYLDATGRVVIIPDDSMAPDAPWFATYSAVETGTEDDLEVSGVYDPDGVGRISGGSLGTFGAVEEAPPRAE